ncbi:hypothetical protein Y032_0017g3234 [Ancylostoma ceylanicum]|uniref:Uncharacterized protein n=1 Tax=Ancylostoma ceylanicum TaxID=53326 RepID=A0A016V458_9BILA|nr:hypothetical protein Y032_0017g3234 [Ancylostoma ceylanicum]
MNEKKESKVYGKESPSNDSLTLLLRLTICLGAYCWISFMFLMAGYLSSTITLLLLIETATNCWVTRD